MRRPHILRIIVIGTPLPDLFGAEEERFSYISYERTSQTNIFSLQHQDIPVE